MDVVGEKLRKDGSVDQNIVESWVDYLKLIGRMNKRVL